MNKKKRKKILYSIAIPFFIILLLILSVSASLFWGGYNYTSDIECINSSESFHVDEIIFKYENENKEFLIYKDSYDVMCQSILKKRKSFGETKYKMWISETAAPATFYKEWTEVDRNLRYIFVKYENDIEDIDCRGFEPIGTKIYYSLSNGEQKSCWIYIIDEGIV